MSTPHPQVWSLNQFLDWESGQTERFEYLDGMIVGMVGGTVRHQLIISNIAHAFRTHLDGSSCHVFSEGLKLLTPTTLTYPDVVVTCASLDLSADVLTDADLVVEVLSPSTADFDLGRKWEGYKKLSSLRAYVVVWQDRPALQIYRRVSQDWTVVTLGADDSPVSLPVADLTLSLQDVYAGADVG